MVYTYYLLIHLLPLLDSYGEDLEKLYENVSVLFYPEYEIKDKINFKTFCDKTKKMKMQ